MTEPGIEPWSPWPLANTLPIIPMGMLYEIQTALSRIWTHVAISISYDDSHFTMGTSQKMLL